MARAKAIATIYSYKYFCLKLILRSRRNFANIRIFVYKMESKILITFSFALFSGIKCPVCSKFVLPDDIECHLVMCLTKPRLSYNGKYCQTFFILLIAKY